MEFQRLKISLSVRKIETNENHRFRLFISAEEREDLEMLNNFRQKQLELKHHQLLQELENLKSARQIQTLADMHQSSIDANFKSLM